MYIDNSIYAYIYMYRYVSRYIQTGSGFLLSVGIHSSSVFHEIPKFPSYESLQKIGSWAFLIM